jgi:hypothetical protein
MLIGSPALADPPEEAGGQDPGDTGQDNKNWGTVASNLARLPTDGSDGTGGAMGQHTRSTEAADINGGFANSENGFDITFNEENEDGNHGRDGVGNVTRDVHHAQPGDGGNGQHALNNAGLAGQLDPITGEAVEVGAENFTDELLEGTSPE